MWISGVFGAAIVVNLVDVVATVPLPAIALTSAVYVSPNFSDANGTQLELSGRKVPDTVWPCELVSFTPYTVPLDAAAISVVTGRALALAAGVILIVGAVPPAFCLAPAFAAWSLWLQPTSVRGTARATIAAACVLFGSFLVPFPRRVQRSIHRFAAVRRCP